MAIDQSVFPSNPIELVKGDEAKVLILLDSKVSISFGLITLCPDIIFDIQDSEEEPIDEAIFSFE